MAKIINSAIVATILICAFCHFGEPKVRCSPLFGCTDVIGEGCHFGRKTLPRQCNKVGEGCGWGNFCKEGLCSLCPGLYNALEGGYCVDCIAPYHHCPPFRSEECCSGSCSWRWRYMNWVCDELPSWASKEARVNATRAVGIMQRCSYFRNRG